MFATASATSRRLLRFALLASLVGAGGCEDLPFFGEGEEERAAKIRGPVTDVAAGGGHTCATSASGTHCWGVNEGGQLGDATSQASQVPVAVRGRPVYARIYAAGGIPWPEYATGGGSDPFMSYSCGLTAQGAAYCWGNDFDGQLGTGMPRPVEGPGPRTDRPIPVVGDFRFVALALGHAGTCGLTADGFTWCWGGRYGPSTDPQYRMAPALLKGAPLFRALAGGNRHACGVTEGGEAWCWGSNRFGQLAQPPQGLDDDRPSPQRVPADARFVSIAGGSVHTCALTADGQAWCWGRNDKGQLGIGTAEGVCMGQFGNTSSCIGGPYLPRRVAGDARFRELTLGQLHTCGLTEGGEAWCWGWNYDGQLGDGGTQDRSAPVQVGGGQRFVRLVAGERHTCGVSAELGELFCWGRNLHGQLGTGTTQSHAVPTRVSNQEQAGTRVD